MLSPNKAFIRMIAAIVVLALMKLEVVDAGSKDTITDIITMVITGLSFFLFALYEFKHLKHQLNEPSSDKQPFYLAIIRKLIDKLFVSEKTTTISSSNGNTVVSTTTNTN